MVQKYIDEALVHYNMQGATTKLIRHNENITVQVDGKYLLRVHKHVDGFNAYSIFEGLDTVEIHNHELSFLSYLNSQGMKVQVPIKNSSGELVTLLSDGTAASMLQWIPGHSLGQEELTPELCYKIGEMVAKLHDLSSGFSKVKVLEYDDALCNHLKQLLLGLRDKGILDTESTEIMIAVSDVCTERLKEAEHENILVHSDLSLPNILLTEFGVVPIDFSLMGYCHPMRDIGCLFCSIWKPELVRAVARGYSSTGKSINLSLIDCNIALNVLLGVVVHCEGWTDPEESAKRLAHCCTYTFRPFVEGKALIPPEVIFSND